MLNDLINSLQQKVAIFMRRKGAAASLDELREFILDDDSRRIADELTGQWMRSTGLLSKQQNIAVIIALASYTWSCWLVSSDQQTYEMAISLYTLLERLSAAEVPPEIRPILQKRRSTRSQGEHSVGAVLAGVRETASLADIDKAIYKARKDVARTPKQGYARAAALGGLASFLQMKYDVTNDIDSLNETIQSLRTALVGVPPRHSVVPSVKYNLANALWKRFSKLGRRVDIDETISLYQQAVKEAPPGHPYRPTRLANLAFAYNLRYESYNDAKDLDDAIDHAEAAVKMDHPGLGTTLEIYAACLMRRFEKNHDEKGLDKVINVQKRALASLPEHVAKRNGILATLGALFRWKFELTRKSQYIDDAVQLGSNAYTSADAEAPSRVVRAMMLAETYAVKFRAYSFPEDSRVALQLWQEAVNSNAPTPLRMRAARDQGEFAVDIGEWTVALEAYAACVQLLEVLAWRGISRNDQAEWLREWGGIPGIAASAAIAAGDLNEAISLLEQGHGVLWAQLMSFRMDFESLGIPSELATRLHETGQQLEQSWDV